MLGQHEPHDPVPRSRVRPGCHRMRSQLLVVLLVSGGAVLLLEKQIWSLKATVYKLQDSLTNPAAGKRSRQAVSIW